MPREFDLTALKPFDYNGRVVEVGEALHGVPTVAAVKLIWKGRARFVQAAPRKAKRVRRKKSEPACNSSD